MLKGWTLVQGFSLESYLSRNKFLIPVPGEQWREQGCFPKLAPFGHKARPKGDLLLSYLVLRLWKVCHQKRGNNLFFFSVRAAWRHCSLFLFCIPLSKANQCNFVRGENFCCSKPSYSWPYPLADFARKRARECNPTSAVGTVTWSPFTRDAAATEGRALWKE